MNFGIGLFMIVMCVCVNKTCFIAYNMSLIHYSMFYCDLSSFAHRLPLDQGKQYVILSTSLCFSLASLYCP